MYGFVNVCKLLHKTHRTENLFSLSMILCLDANVGYFGTSRSRSTGFSILRVIPFTVIVVHDSGATSFGDGGCTQAATGGAVRGRRRHGAVAAASRRFQRLPLDRVRV